MIGDYAAKKCNAFTVLPEYPYSHMNFKSLVPRPIKKALRALHRAHTLRSSLRQLDSRLGGTDPIPTQLVADLIYGWGNEGWSAKPELLSHILEAFRRFDGTALECGSGISTLLLATIARRTGARLFSLEHDPSWLEAIKKRSESLGLPSSGLVHAPLKDFGTYSWYDTEGRLPNDAGFDLVLCDGPPESTHGGRYGLLPKIHSKLLPGAQVILDDAHRKSESVVLERWLAEHPGRLRISKTFPTFVVLEVG